MISSVSDDGVEWTPYFVLDSVILTVEDLNQEMTISSQEILSAAWS